MAGRRLLDAAKLLHAATSIARQHLQLRSQQLHVFGETSTLAKAARSQTDRVTLTLEAARVLAQRLNESRQHQEREASPRSPSEAPPPTRAGSPSPSPSPLHSQTAQASDVHIEGAPLDQHIHHDTAPLNQHIHHDAPLDQHIHHDTAPLNQHIHHDAPLNQHIHHAAPAHVPREHMVQPTTIPAQNGSPPAINTDVFRTKRVADMLGSHTLQQKPRPALHSVAKNPVDHAEPQAQPDTADEVMHDFASNGAGTEPQKTPYELRESRVPSSRFGRLWQYAGLGTSMAFGAVGESLRRATGTAAASGGSLMLSPGNLEILVAKLSRMRGAALKLGQIISFQDAKMLPPAIHQVLQRVQDSADYMPASQRNKVLANNLGNGWRDLFDSFDDKPIAAASIGQVHKAVLRSTKQTVAVKVQYPGVADSIDSDLNNLSILLTASRLLPKGLFLDRTIANARTELAWECDYVREAEWQERFRSALADDTNVFKVPKTFPEACGPQVLTAELVHGVGVAKLPTLSQEKRDWIGTQILRLCLREIVELKFMQTDPNWTNFLYNERDHKIELLDFGASREYPDEFVDPYVNVLIAASKDDRTTIRDLSIQLGYLTGAESKPMLDAHIQSVLTLAEPFQASGPDMYDFKDQTITDRVRSLIPVMVRERLAPPPEETYSLHRKLSGAFLLCARLGSKVPCRELFENAVKAYRNGGEMKSADQG